MLVENQVLKARKESFEEPSEAAKSIECGRYI